MSQPETLTSTSSQLYPIIQPPEGYRPSFLSAKQLPGGDPIYCFFGTGPVVERVLSDNKSSDFSISPPSSHRVDTPALAPQHYLGAIHSEVVQAELFSYAGEGFHHFVSQGIPLTLFVSHYLPGGDVLFFGDAFIKQRLVEFWTFDDAAMMSETQNDSGLGNKNRKGSIDVQIPDEYGEYVTVKVEAPGLSVAPKNADPDGVTRSFSLAPLATRQAAGLFARLAAEFFQGAKDGQDIATIMLMMLSQMAKVPELMKAFFPRNKVAKAFKPTLQLIFLADLLTSVWFFPIGGKSGAVDNMLAERRFKQLIQGQGVIPEKLMENLIKRIAEYDQVTYEKQCSNLKEF